MTYAVELDDAGVCFGDRWVWRHASFAVESGAFVAIVGPNGAGKSTLLKSMLGLLPLTEGTVRVNGIAPHSGNPSIGYMPQLRPVEAGLAVCGRDVVRFGSDGSRWGMPTPGAANRAHAARVQRAIDAVDAAAFADRPLGSLSGGEAQRLFLAQALVGEPELLILDEPLANLDLRSRAATVALIASIARRRRISVALVTHDVNGLLPFVDRVVYVANARIVAGPPDEVITTATLSRVYDADVEVLIDSRGLRYVVGLQVTS
jgi:zinc/manganese transport system ATP-binding protein